MLDAISSNSLIDWKNRNDTNQFIFFDCNIIYSFMILQIHFTAVTAELSYSRHQNFVLKSHREYYVSFSCLGKYPIKDCVLQVTIQYFFRHVIPEYSRTFSDLFNKGKTAGWKYLRGFDYP